MFIPMWLLAVLILFIPGVLDLIVGVGVLALAAAVVLTVISGLGFAVLGCLHVI